MCGRYALTTPADVLAELYRLTVAEIGGVPEGATLEERFNIAPTQPAPIVRERRGAPASGEGPRRCLDLLRWGLIPSWASDPEIGYRMINARCESAAEKPAFRNALRWRRCLVPADGFYEWRRAGRHKQPYFLHRADGGLLAFAGLWERWRARDEDPWTESFTILTTDANEEVRPLHDRMPLIVSEEDFDRWLDRDIEDLDAIADLLRPDPDGLLAVYPVSTLVNSPANEGPALLEEVEAVPESKPARPEDEQQMLF